MGKKPKKPPRPRPSTVEEALEQFDARFEGGDPEGALEVAEAGLRRFAEAAALHHARGLALWSLGRGLSAAESLHRATELDPTAAEPQLDLAAILVDELDRPEDALQVLRAARAACREPGQRASMHALRGRAFLALEDPRSAESELRSARKLEPEDASLAVALAEARLDALDARGAEAALSEAIELDDRAARPRWLRAVLRDRAGDAEGAAREFARAAALDPEHYFVPVRLDEAEFDARVEAAVARIPARFRRHLDNTEIAVEPYPGDEFLRAQNLSPLILGVFVGTPRTELSYDSSDLPPRILIFQRNLENVCRSRDELLREIRTTVRHEIGHLLGMSEEAIHEAGHG